MGTRIRDFLLKVISGGGVGVGCLLESNYSKGEPKSLFFLRDIMMC